MSTFALAGAGADREAGGRLGWDQRRDVHPDGSTTGPYEAWQVIGLVPAYWAVSRGHTASVILGTTAGLTAAARYDWSDDAGGLFVIGVVLVTIGGLAGTAAVSGVIAMAGRGVRRTAFRPAPPQGCGPGA
nr:hypothetical protein [Streptomyces sp. NRRL WC-3744]